ncbi:hypothetical protein Tco_1045747 [Tanacetum coccineum]|uniref:Uncharacterized protein n=1 Tax=Tanacetum coccineum TaxID=301880 RepID=A0ABQ5GTQ2_9ASTR
MELRRNTTYGYAVTMEIHKYGMKITYVWKLFEGYGVTQHRNNCLFMECRVRRLRRNTFISYAVTGLILINRGLIQAIPTSLLPQPIGEATKASNL